jgi:hypothetical protein
MSDKIARVTPREIAEMLVNEQAYADTRFVLAAEHDAEIERLRARVAVLERACRLIQADPDPHAVVECTGCYRHSRLAFHALEATP